MISTHKLFIHLPYTVGREEHFEGTGLLYMSAVNLKFPGKTS
jgi:hypothetical protein